MVKLLSLYTVLLKVAEPISDIKCGLTVHTVKSQVFLKEFEIMGRGHWEPEGLVSGMGYESKGSGVERHRCFLKCLYVLTFCYASGIAMVNFISQLD